jgi:hypothetical protein
MRKKAFFIDSCYNINWNNYSKAELSILASSGVERGVKG